MSDKEQQKIFSKNLTSYLDKNNLSQIEVANAIGVSPQTFNTWCNGIAVPRMGSIQKLADFFGIPKSNLIDEADNNEPSYYTNPETAKLAQEVFDDPNLRILMDASKDLTPEDLKLAIDMVKRLKGNND